MEKLKITLAAALCLFAAQMLPQQRRGGTPPPIEQRVEKGAENAQKELALSADQKERWKAAARERMTANDALREKMKGSTTPEERKKIREEMRGNNRRFDESVSGMLDAGQKAKYEKMKKERMEKRKGRGNGKHDDMDDAD
jgi:hypothetical protein